MKQFFKFMFASMLGFFISLFLIFLFMIMIISSVAYFTSRRDVQISDPSVLYVKLDMPVQDRGTKNPFDAFGSMGRMRPIGLNQVIRSIENAARDDRIKCIYLEMGMFQSGMATVEEIRNALKEFRKSGKPVIAYGENINQKSYYLATAADKIYANPMGNLDFTGLSAQGVFFKGLSEKLKVEMQIIRPENNRYKSAVEPFYLDRMSEANREQTAQLLQSVWRHMLKGISKARDIREDKLNVVADSLLAFRAVDALSNRMVDGLIYYDQFLDTLRNILGLKDKARISSVTVAQYCKADRQSNKKEGSGKLKHERIAVIYASGSIVMGEEEDRVISAKHISQTIRKAHEDKKIKAIVLRVNSPGGDGLASEMIWREVALAAKVKPVIVSMGDVAASGGYYISCAATKIVAQPSTLTGSIGVFGVLPNMEPLFREHLGITFDEVNTNENSNFGSVVRPLSPYQFQFLTRYVDDFYTHFVTHVSEGRGLSASVVDSIGQGRVWSGTDALELGLVDELGGLEEAVKLAAHEAGISEYSVLEWPVQTDPFLRLIREMSGDVSVNKSLRMKLGADYRWVEILATYSRMKGIQARLPYDITIE